MTRSKTGPRAGDGLTAVFAAAMIARSAIPAEARLIGTPHQHQASAKGAGCDCLGLVRCGARFTALVSELAPAYTPDWAERQPKRCSTQRVATCRNKS